MSEKLFSQGYVDQYDLLYSDKDYKAECDLLEEVFKRYGKGSVKTILDLGCGTGNHTIPLAQRGYQVTGVDHSQDMLVQARLKAAELGQTYYQPTFHHGDVCNLNINRTFDVILMMFAVLGYQSTNEEVLSALGTVRRHLRPAGLFVCDVWYGPAVISTRPSDRLKVIPTDDGKVIRAASGKLDTYRHICQVNYLMWRLKGHQVVSETVETHQIRFFFAQELSHYMSCVGLELISLTVFPSLDQQPDDNSWNILVVGKAADSH